MKNIQSLVTALQAIPGSQFDPFKPEWLESADKDYPGMPDDLRELYIRLGYGSVGKSRYMIHALLEPEDIFGDAAGEELKGLVIVGDDFAGNCEAYDTKNGWRFGSLDSFGEFAAHEDPSHGFLEFLQDFIFPEQEKG